MLEQQSNQFFLEPKWTFRQDEYGKGKGKGKIRGKFF